MVGNMKCYDLRIAGISFRLECKKEITLNERLAPFVSDRTDTPDFVYRIETGALPMEKEEFYRCPDLQIYYETGRYYRYQKRTLYKEEGWICTFPVDEGRTYKILCSKSFFESDVVMKNLNLSFCMALEENLLKKDAFYLHASFVAFQEAGILFTAPSGTGKSTQAELWKKYFHAEIVNGDRVIVRKEAEDWYAYGSPYAGSSRIYKNKRMKIKAIIVLEQSAENLLSELSGAPAFSALYRESLMNTWNTDYMNAISGLIFEAASEIPMYCLKCRPDYEAAKSVKEALF